MILYQGRRYKLYRGMGSMGAMKEGSKDRYFQNNTEESKLVPEGIEGRVPFKGSLAEMVYQFVGGLRSGMIHGLSKYYGAARAGTIVRITRLDYGRVMFMMFHHGRGSKLSNFSGGVTCDNSGNAHYCCY